MFLVHRLASSHISLCTNPAVVGRHPVLLRVKDTWSIFHSPRVSRWAFQELGGKVPIGKGMTVGKGMNLVVHKRVCPRMAS